MTKISKDLAIMQSAANKFGAKHPFDSLGGRSKLSSRADIYC